MSTSLVVYFSASGVTARVAENLATAIGADLAEIKPAVPYTAPDLAWQNSLSRSSVEMKDLASRPAVANHIEHIAQYERIFVGFPIWWYVAPTIINTFLEQYDFTGKKIIPFATSGGSGMGETNRHLRASCPGAMLCDGKRFDAHVNLSALREWAETV